MKKKQEVIQQSYEELGLPFHDNYLYDNGWMKIKPNQYSSLYDKVDLLKLTAHVHSVRPKSLSGIETNNGWIRIECEADLPKESGKYWVTYKDVRYKQDQEVFYVGKGWDCFLDVTHYQPIINPLPPIY